MSTAPDTPATPPVSPAPGDSDSAPVTQLTDNIKSTLSAADKSTAQGVSNLKLVHQARLSQLTRTAANLQAQYGASDPGVVSAQAAATACTGTIGRISIIDLQVGTPAPVVAATGWALHGRVFTAQMQPAAGLTVFLVDGQNAYQQAYGFTFTDKKGYFLLNFTGTAGQTPASIPIFVEVANSSKKAIYLSKTAFQPVLGSSTYLNITLPASAPPLGDPPKSVRAVAFPDLKGRQTG